MQFLHVCIMSLIEIKLPFIWMAVLFVLVNDAVPVVSSVIQLDRSWECTNERKID
jgi:hypothetical protein